MIGGYWTRSNDVEIDIAGADREPVARQLLFLGSVKWLETGPFDARDLLALQRHRDLDILRAGQAQRVLRDHLADLLGRDRFGQMVWAKVRSASGGSGLCRWPVLETGQAS